MARTRRRKKGGAMRIHELPDEILRLRTEIRSVKEQVMEMQKEIDMLREDVGEPHGLDAALRGHDMWGHPGADSGDDSSGSEGRTNRSLRRVDSDANKDLSKFIYSGGDASFGLPKAKSKPNANVAVSADGHTAIIGLPDGKAQVWSNANASEEWVKKALLDATQAGGRRRPKTRRKRRK